MLRPKIFAGALLSILLKTKCSLAFEKFIDTEIIGQGRCSNRDYCLLQCRTLLKSLWRGLFPKCIVYCTWCRQWLNCRKPLNTTYLYIHFFNNAIDHPTSGPQTGVRYSDYSKNHSYCTYMHRNSEKTVVCNYSNVICSYKTVICSCKTVIFSYKAVISGCKTVICSYKTVICGYKTVKCFYKTVICSYKTIIAIKQLYVAIRQSCIDM